MVESVEYGLGQRDRLHNQPELLKQGTSCAIRGTPYSRPLPGGVCPGRVQRFNVSQGGQTNAARDMKSAPEQSAQAGRFASDEDWIRAGFQWQDETIGHDDQRSLAKDYGAISR